MTLRPPANTRQALAYVAQHLRRAGFSDEAGSALMPGTTPASFARLAQEAESMRPALCLQRCAQRPLCPFCEACMEIELHARAHQSG